MTSAGSTNALNQPLDENFIRRLIEAVKSQPCLYNPNHEHYGNRHANAQYRARVWQKLCVDLEFTEDAHILQTHWKRLRDRYLRERRKRKNNIISDSSHLESGNFTRERHVSESSSSGNTTSLAGSRYFEMMRWIEPYLADVTPSSSFGATNINPSDNCSNGATVQKGQSSGNRAAVVTTSENTDTFYVNRSNSTHSDHSEPALQQAGSKNEVMLSCFEQRDRQKLQAERTEPRNRDYTKSCGNIPNGSSGRTNTQSDPSPINASPSSSTTSSEIDVGSVPTISGQTITQQQSNIQRQHPSQRILYTKAEVQPRSSMQTCDGSVYTLMSQGIAPSSSKKDVSLRTSDGNAVAMVIDTANYYQHGNQKMYRLVNVSEMNAELVPLSAGNAGSSTNEVKLITVPRIQSSSEVSHRRKRLAPGSLPSISNGRGQLGDDLILDDGTGNTIVEKTITIDQTSPISGDRLLLDHSVSASNILGHHSLQQVHIQNAGGSAQHGSVITSGHHVQLSHQINHPGSTQINVVAMRPQQQNQRFITQQLSVQQPHYTMLTNQSITNNQDEHLEFANSIATHLARLNDDEKAVAKMNIQRILMDARFGLGACARMIHDEELTEVATTSTTHEMIVNTQQHQDPSTRR